MFYYDIYLYKEIDIMINIGFSEAELIGRIKFDKWLKKRNKAKQICFTPDKYDKVDCVVYNGITSATTELKNRLDYSSTDKVIKDEGVVIEKSKYKYLLETISSSGMSNCYYCMIFKDDIMYLFDINRISKEKEVIWRLKNLPKSTCGNNTLIIKEYATLPLEWGVKFKL